MGPHDGSAVSHQNFIASDKALKKEWTKLGFFSYLEENSINSVSHSTQNTGVSGSSRRIVEEHEWKKKWW